MSEEEKKRAAVWVLNLYRECAEDAGRDSWLDAPGNAERRLLNKLAAYAGWLQDGAYGECRDDDSDTDDNQRLTGAVEIGRALLHRKVIG